MDMTTFDNGIFASPVIGANNIEIFTGSRANVYFVDGDKGNDGNSGLSPMLAKKTIQAAVTTAATRNLLQKSGSVVYVKAKYMAAGSTDPVSYAETVIIPAAGGERMAIIGISNGRVQMGLPQIKKGSGTSPQITVRASGCTIASMGVNGIDATGGGILLDDDSSTKTACGTTIINCHFKNCVGSTATDCRTGGAIMWASTGCAWQVLIKGNRFYKNVGDVVLKGTSVSVPQDVIIEDNIFSGPATSVDCNLYLAGGSGMNGVIVRNNIFPSVLPALSSGSIVRYVDMTGCVGIFADNYVGGVYTTSGFGAAKAAAKIPATVGIAHNYSDSGLIVREA